jgi:hypothetical protein
VGRRQELVKLLQASHLRLPGVILLFTLKGFMQRRMPCANRKELVGAACDGVSYELSATHFPLGNESALYESTSREIHVTRAYQHCRCLNEASFS